jgi:hypothetical protein
MLEHTQSSLLTADEAAATEQTITGSGLSRRNFLVAAGLTAGAAGTLGLAGCGSVLGVDPLAGPAPSIEDVLNFALNLEYLEANFYLYIATGQGLPPSLQGTNPGAVPPVPAVQFTDPNVAALAKQLAADELAHVTFLRAGLVQNGFTPVDQPALNLTALGAVTNDATFLATARQLETVGVSAYEGGVPYIAASLPALEYAALIHDTEGQHEGVLRQFCIAKGISSPAVDHYDTPPSLSSSTIFNTNQLTGVNPTRNTSEVLQIVYAAPGKLGVTSGGFFPNGLNGNIKST